MSTTFKPLALAALLSLGAALAHATPAPSNDTALQLEAQASLTQKLANDAKDLTVQVHNGTATLTGWTKSPIQEAEARELVSLVPGISHAYSRVHTWSSTGIE